MVYTDTTVHARLMSTFVPELTLGCVHLKRKMNPVVSHISKLCSQLTLSTVYIEIFMGVIFRKSPKNFTTQLLV